MSSYIKTPAALNAIGSRDNNEDYIYPLVGEADQSSRLFMVCDGMGGPRKGEVAAKLVAESFARDINSFPPDGQLYKGYLDQTLISTEEALSTYMKAYPESIGMGSTMAMIHLHGNQATLAWVGNSRIFHYQLKEKKLSVTEATELSSSQDSFQWNPIPQVIHGIETPTQLQFQTIELSHGDYLFICTDGILEQIDEGVLHTLFSTGNPPTDLIEEIRTLSEDSTQDNYSCYMLQMELEDTPIPVTPLTVPPVMEAPEEEMETQFPDPEPETTPEVETNSMGSNIKEDPIAATPEEGNVKKQNVDVGVLIGIVAVLVIGGVLIWTQVLSSSPYKSYVKKAKAMESAQNYEGAIQYYDSAYNATEAASEKQEALALKQQARTALEAQQPQADQLTANGAEAFANTDYQAAIDNYEAALEAHARNQAVVPEDFPYEELARSYVMIAKEKDAKAAKTPEDEEQILSLYDKASAIYNELQARGIQLADESYSEMAKARGGELTKKLADLLALNTSNRGLPANTNTNRPVESPEKPATQTTTKPATKAPAKSTSTQKPSTNKPKANTSNTPTARTVAPRTNVRATVTASTPEGQHLLDGKRIYNEAKANSNDPYRYRMAIEHLKMAGDKLDGSGAYLLAYMYHSGLGVAADENEALNYAQKSANMGWAGGYYLYAYCLLKRNNKVDSANAVKSLKKAAAKKHQPSIDLLKKMGESV